MCWDRDAKGASFRFFGVDEEAVVGGRLLCNGEQPRIFRICKECEGVRGRPGVGLSRGAPCVGSAGVVCGGFVGGLLRYGMTVGVVVVFGLSGWLAASTASNFNFLSVVARLAFGGPGKVVQVAQSACQARRQ